jgi:hypothetical protein
MSNIVIVNVFIVLVEIIVLYKYLCANVTSNGPDIRDFLRTEISMTMGLPLEMGLLDKQVFMEEEPTRKDSTDLPSAPNSHQHLSLRKMLPNPLPLSYLLNVQHHSNERKLLNDKLPAPIPHVEEKNQDPSITEPQRIPEKDTNTSGAGLPRRTLIENGLQFNPDNVFPSEFHYLFKEETFSSSVFVNIKDITDYDFFRLLLESRFSVATAPKIIIVYSPVTHEHGSPTTATTTTATLQSKLQTVVEKTSKLFNSRSQRKKQVEKEEHEKRRSQEEDNHHENNDRRNTPVGEGEEIQYFAMNYPAFSQKNPILKNLFPLEVKEEDEEKHHPNLRGGETEVSEESTDSQLLKIFSLHFPPFSSLSGTKDEFDIEGIEDLKKYLEESSLKKVRTLIK